MAEGTNLDRVETGVVQIGDDWPGVFIRGDNALMRYAPALEALLTGQQDLISRTGCESLLRLLRSCEAGEEGCRVITPAHNKAQRGGRGRGRRTG